MKPYVASHLRDMNQKVIFRLMEDKEVLSRADIARATNISAPTVMKITQKMVDRGILLESGEGKTALGRKPMLLRFNPEAAYTVGVDYRVGHVELAVVDLKGTIRYSARETIDTSFIDHLDRLLGNRVMAFIGASGIDRSRILGTGITIPGAVDTERNYINFAPLIGIDERADISPIIERLSDELEMAVMIENDVNAAAVGEYMARQAMTNEDIVYITVGKGVGAGIIIDGKLYKGVRRSAGEVGYMVFDRNFTTRINHEGWLEEQINKRRSVEDTASYTALCIANLSSVLDIRMFVVGGEFAETLGESFLQQTRQFAEKLCVHETVIEGRSSEKPSLRGMSSLIRDQLLDLIFTD